MVLWRATDVNYWAIYCTNSRTSGNVATRSSVLPQGPVAFGHNNGDHSYPGIVVRFLSKHGGMMGQKRTLSPLKRLGELGGEMLIKLKVPRSMPFGFLIFCFLRSSQSWGSTVRAVGIKNPNIFRLYEKASSRLLAWGSCLE
jgi:hypothetical protein